MSSIKITHDGGQVTPLTGIYILAEGNVTNYSIDSTYDITSIEKIAFDIGVDYVANHGNTSNWSPSHPLGPKTPPMDWGWPAGYFFLILDGKVDNTGDGSPNLSFQLECFGDDLSYFVSVDMPLYQDLNGFQFATQNQLTFGVSYRIFTMEPEVGGVIK
jgi:hypothetical protein